MSLTLLVTIALFVTTQYELDSFAVYAQGNSNPLERLYHTFLET